MKTIQIDDAELFDAVRKHIKKERDHYNAHNMGVVFREGKTFLGATNGKILVVGCDQDVSAERIVGALDCDCISELGDEGKKVIIPHEYAIAGRASIKLYDGWIVRGKKEKTWDHRGLGFIKLRKVFAHATQNATEIGLELFEAIRKEVCQEAEFLFGASLVPEVAYGETGYQYNVTFEGGRHTSGFVVPSKLVFPKTFRSEKRSLRIPVRFLSEVKNPERVWLTNRGSTLFIRSKTKKGGVLYHVFAGRAELDSHCLEGYKPSWNYRHMEDKS